MVNLEQEVVIIDWRTGNAGQYVVKGPALVSCSWHQGKECRAERTKSVWADDVKHIVTLKLISREPSPPVWAGGCGVINRNQITRSVEVLSKVPLFEILRRYRGQGSPNGAAKPKPSQGSAPKGLIAPIVNLGDIDRTSRCYAELVLLVNTRSW